jgi:undecaprenyl-diphosphatase
MLLAILQGVSELFPVSSLGHTVLVPALLRWHVDRTDPTFLAFVVVLHLGTALALVVFYRVEWRALTTAFLASVVRGKMSGSRDERVAWLLVAGTVPVGVLGVLFESTVRSLFGSSAFAAGFLVLNAGIMFAGERLRRASLRRGAANRPLAALPWPDGIKVGLAQGLALLPGISRSGSSIVAGLLLDLSHEDAARYSFLLATPVILAAALLEIPRLFEPSVRLALGESIAGCLLAGITAYVSVAFLTKYFETNDLRPFGWYCLGFGTLCLVLVFAKVIV